ncbi:PLP-dependent cysteine synthase family protein [Actinomadura chokoriensis]|uniref:Pyridoxal-phosphate dependent enzyme n=1 Tax=Actinomadura chokoriensis TaxID=454156 RepID=A0ABV4QYJ1_9ACTN
MAWKSTDELAPAGRRAAAARDGADEGRPSGDGRPGIAPDAAGRFESLAATVGRTPVVEIRPDETAGARILVKTEGANPTGSIKDRACVALFRELLRDPEWSAGKTVLDASSGNMGCSLAYFGRLLGIPTRIVASSRLTPEKRFFMEYFGAAVETVGDFTIEGNRFARSVAAAEPGRWYFMDQLHNPVNVQAHFAGTGPEVLAQVPGVAAVVGSVGTGGTLLGTGRFLKQVDARIAVVAVEAASGTRIPGTASLADGDYRSPFIAAGCEEGVFDTSIPIAEEQAAQTARALLDMGVFGGLQTGAVVAAAREFARRNDVRGDVVAIAGDSGWKNGAALRDKVLRPARSDGERL